jgi:hypothetical protein
MLLPAPPLYPRKRKPRPTRRPPAPVVTGPVLVSAAFDGGTLTLGFDRAIDLAGFDPTQVIVDDGNVPVEWAGTIDFSQPGANSVAIVMIENGEFAGTGVSLSVTGGAGIVAADGGVAWAGVAGLELPWP